MTRAEAIEAATREYMKAIDAWLWTPGPTPDAVLERVLREGAVVATALSLPPDPTPSPSERDRALVRAGIDRAEGVINANEIPVDSITDEDIDEDIRDVDEAADQCGIVGIGLMAPVCVLAPGHDGPHREMTIGTKVIGEAPRPTERDRALVRSAGLGMSDREADRLIEHVNRTHPLQPDDARATREFLRRTAGGGTIVSSAALTPTQIAIARAADRLLVTPNGYGFVYVPGPLADLVPQPDDALLLAVAAEAWLEGRASIGDDDREANVEYAKRWASTTVDRVRAEQAKTGGAR